GDVAGGGLAPPQPAQGGGGDAGRRHRVGRFLPGEVQPVVVDGPAVGGLGDARLSLSLTERTPSRRRGPPARVPPNAGRASTGLPAQRTDPRRRPGASS